MSRAERMLDLGQRRYADAVALLDQGSRRRAFSESQRERSRSRDMAEKLKACGTGG